jgi:hypothetical protein
MKQDEGQGLDICTDRESQLSQSTHRTNQNFGGGILQQSQSSARKHNTRTIENSTEKVKSVTN